MKTLILALALVFFVVLLPEDATARVEYEHVQCQSSGDCPKYHWCDSYYCMGDLCSSSCESHLTRSFGSCTNDLDCAKIELAEAEESLGSWWNQQQDVNAAVSKCNMETGTCAKAYFMACSTNDDCPFNFSCNEETFSDGAASVCQPNYPPWNDGNAVECQSVTQCYFETTVNYQAWMPCDGGYCDSFFQW